MAEAADRGVSTGRLELLGDVPAFAHLPEESLEELAGRLREERYREMVGR